MDPGEILPQETNLPVAGTSNLAAETHIWVWFSMATPSNCSAGMTSTGVDVQPCNTNMQKPLAIPRPVFAHGLFNLCNDRRFKTFSLLRPCGVILQA